MVKQNNLEILNKKELVAEVQRLQRLNLGGGNESFSSLWKSNKTMLKHVVRHFYKLKY